MADPNVVLEMSPPPPTAVPPFPPGRRGVGAGTRQFLQLVRVGLTEYRTTWFQHVFAGFMMPLGLLLFLKFFAGEVTADRAIFLIGGNMTTAIGYGPTMFLISKIGWGRHNREFDYWFSLPIPSLSIVLAILTVALVLALPGIAGVYLLGSLVMGLPLTGGLAIIPLIPLGALSLAGFGAFIGTYAKDGQTANMLTNLFLGFITFLSPMMIPAEAMPAPLRLISRLVPTTYAADAFRAAIAGNFGPSLAYDVLILVLFAAGFLVLIHRKLNLRTA